VFLFFTLMWNGPREPQTPRPARPGLWSWGQHACSAHLHLGGLSLQQGLIEQLVELMLVLRGVHHAVRQVLEAQPAAGVGERRVVGL
jgi:hypothetical protein